MSLNKKRTEEKESQVLWKIQFIYCPFFCSLFGEIVSLMIQFSFSPRRTLNCFQSSLAWFFIPLKFSRFCFLFSLGSAQVPSILGWIEFIAWTFPVSWSRGWRKCVDFDQSTEGILSFKLDCSIQRSAIYFNLIRRSEQCR
jgi:hypothetical protein